MKKPNLRKALKQLAKDFEVRIKQTAISDKTVSSGEFANSFSAELIGDEGISISSSSDHAGAVIEGASPAKREMSKADKEEKYRKLGEWARSKGMQPLLRKSVKGKDGRYKKTGRFKKVTKKSYRDLGYVLSRSIAKKGTIKRYDYKGSNILERVYKELETEIGAEITEAYREDLTTEIRRILKVNLDGINIS